MAEEVLSRLASDRDPAMVAISWSCGKYRVRPTGGTPESSYLVVSDTNCGLSEVYLCLHSRERVAQVRRQLLGAHVGSHDSYLCVLIANGWCVGF